MFFSVSVMCDLIKRCKAAFILMPLMLFGLMVGTGQSALAQGYGGGAASVEVTPAKQEVLSIYADVQARMVSGSSVAITAVTNAVTELASLKVGDRVEKGQIIATQDDDALVRALALLKIRHQDAEIRLAEAVQSDRDNVDRQARERDTLLLRLADAKTSLAEIVTNDGERIARLRRERDLLLVELRDAKRSVLDLEAELRHEQEQLAVNRRQFELLDGKSVRAQDLADRNALPLEAAETALGASLNARQQVLSREAEITGKAAQLAEANSDVERTILAIEQIEADLKTDNSYDMARATTAIDRLALEIAQLDQDIAAPDDFSQDRIRAEISQLQIDIDNLIADIADTKLVAPSAGQLVFLTPIQSGFSREGEVIAEILDLADFEVEAEIPVAYLGYLLSSDNLRAVDLNNQALTLRTRAILPTQNARTGTQSVRFSIIGDVPPTAIAENAALVLKVPTSSPAPVVTVAKDAVLPIAGGHIVFVAEDNIAVRKRLRLGEAVGASFVVLDGLEAGEKVIIRGNEALTDGKKIKIGGDDAPRAPQAVAGEEWTLNWTTNRGPASADLVLGTDKSLFNGDEIAVIRAGDSVNFIGQLFLPFGVLDLDFQGTIADDTMSGKVTLRGLPGGREPELDFTGTKVAK